MEIGTYNIYEIDLTKDTSLKVDCSYDDTAFIILEKDNECIDSFELTLSYLASFAKAISYVLNIQNKEIKLTRNISDNPNYRFKVSYYKEKLKIQYEEDSNDKINTEMEVNISPEQAQKVADFFTTVYQCEIKENA